jgi:hypothetical protein
MKNDPVTLKHQRAAFNIMYSYRPPKSSVWGHLLRRMPAERAKTLFSQFLATAVAEYKFTSASLGINDPTGEIVPRYELVVGTPSQDGRFNALTLEQSEKCIDELIRDEKSAGDASRFALAQSFQVTKWRVNGQEASTQSSLIIHYGQLPCLSTFLQFETVEQFQSVQKVLAELGLCKLNEKHLKPMKIPKTK